MNKVLCLGGILLSALLVVGCGGDNTVLTDGGANGDMTVKLFKLQSGTYAVQTATNLVDGCKAFDSANPFTALVGATFTLTNDGQGNIGLGTVGGTPPQPSNGASCPGMPTNAACATASNALPFDNNMGILVRDNMIDDGAGCTEHRHVENLVTLTADNTFTSAYTRTDSQMSTGCTTETTQCTTTWTWTLSKQ